MNEIEMRAAIVAEALSWERTPYLPDARIKGVGCDCVQLPCAVFGPDGVGLIPNLRPSYSSQHMLHCDEGDELYLAEIRTWARDINMTDIRPGDLVVWKFGRVYSHSAIVVDPPIVVHAVVKGGAVIRADMDRDEDLKSKTRSRLAFSVFNQDGSIYKASAT